ncbi:TraR/DksA C4-type zinc finger protein [Magnetospirillum sulfuroxidans]|uniref:TraR/DksA C4-type zinc finger protein n=1 Tax=Magnetospirillum sulfuroxidans TaxID=611300 RepID=A0ABS5IF69_9PROT|nr:TraR/DksA C4-type zinc finger protein [Magnetospirillum sulfuroxidans]MBR9973061.1 TraR/DksA C4-type zinc finger protein [Magnetospirillum sulfuroxidans]
MDDIDCAAERIDAFNAVALQAVLARSSGAVSSGICSACGCDIEADRLRATPHARHCKECAADIEAESRRHNRCGPR